MKTTAFLLTMLVPAVESAQQKPTTGYAPVNGLTERKTVRVSFDFPHTPAPKSRFPGCIP